MIPAKKNPQNEKEPNKKKNEEPSFEIQDFRAHFDDEMNNFVNFRPRRFIPHIQPKLDLFSTITLYGKRRTGKSVFVKWFVQSYKRYFPWIWVFTKTQQNNFYKSFIPEKFILPKFDAGALKKIMERQKTAIKKHVDEDSNLNPRAMLIWDDYPGNDIKFNETLDEYYFTGRHYATMNLFCAQVFSNSLLRESNGRGFLFFFCGCSPLCCLHLFRQGF